MWWLITLKTVLVVSNSNNNNALYLHSTSVGKKHFHAHAILKTKAERQRMMPIIQMRKTEAHKAMQLHNDEQKGGTRQAGPSISAALRGAPPACHQGPQPGTPPPSSISVTLLRTNRLWGEKGPRPRKGTILPSPKDDSQEPSQGTY